MKKAKKLIALTLASIMTFSCSIMAFASDGIDYTINNPYATVDFANWGQYKADLHCHTTASDGDEDMNVMIEEHYSQGYDILALTDHGITSKGWTTVSSRNYFKIALSIALSMAVTTITPATNVIAADKGTSIKIITNKETFI